MSEKHHLLRSNRRTRSTSPHLLHHKNNPVDWYLWSEDAINRAVEEDKPIFLSIGYSSCHWCHAMERESFSNDEIAAFLNEHFISIKVDREERPDLDEIYSTAVHAMTGTGGWPLNVFLTPDLKPFHGGNYFPPEENLGKPGFRRVIEAVAHSWRDRREMVLSNAEGLAGHVRTRLDDSKKTVAGENRPNWKLLDGAVRFLTYGFDPVNGGWGSAPKYPSSGPIHLLLRQWKRTEDRQALQMATFVLDQMARGGLYDHVGGGFHRYSNDMKWFAPRFEKMLYDNAQLIALYIEAWQATGEMRFRRVAGETLDYVLRDMTGEQGEFFSSEDADSEGSEGRYYLWTRNEVFEALGKVRGEMFARLYGISESGNFVQSKVGEPGLNILHLVRPLEELAKEMGIPANRLDAELMTFRERLLRYQVTRIRPDRDDKTIAAWNGLMISACAKGAQALEKARYADAAVRAGCFLVENMYKDGVLTRSWRAGRAGSPGFLSDYACVANAFVDLYETTFDQAWLISAERLVDQMLDEFGDEESPLLQNACARHGSQISRSYPVTDYTEPSGNAMAATVMLRLYHHLNRRNYRDRAAAILESQSALMSNAPESFARMLCALDLLLGEPLKIALIAGTEGPSVERAFLREVHSRFLPNRALTRSSDKDGKTFGIELFGAGKNHEGSRPVDGLTTAYICTPKGCERPYLRPRDLASRLDRNLFT